MTLQDAAANCPGLSPGAVVVSSAGTHATPGAPSCDIAQAHVGRSSRDQTALQLTGEMLAAADLVITAERKHADAVASISTEFGRRCFPARVAARLATWVVDSGSLGSQFENERRGNRSRLRTSRNIDRPAAVRSVARLRWLVAQMDGGRGLTHRRRQGIFPTASRTSRTHTSSDSTCTK